MADVFISYAREDRQAVEKLSALLEAAGLTCWWDKQLTAGTRYLEKTEAELVSSKAVLVIWTKHSVASHWVADEAGIGRDAGRLVPISLDGSLPPLGFRQFQVMDFSGWRGGAEPRVAELAQALAAFAPEREIRAMAAKHRHWSPFGGRQALIVLSVLLVAALLGWLGKKHFEAAARTQETRVAVLRFESLGEAQPYFVQEVADELIAELTRINGIEVTARASSFALTGERATPANANRELGATLVLSGSVRQVDDKVRVQAQLVTAPGGTQIWAETFERPSSEIYVLQRDIAIRVARAASVQFRAPPPRRVEPEAYRLYLEGRRLQYSEHGTSMIGDPQDFYRRAVARDPQFAEAWSALGRNEVIQIAERHNVEEVASEAQFGVAIAAADRALAIDPALPEAWVTKSDIAAMTGHWEEAVRFADKALQFPGYHPFRAYSLTGRLADLMAVLKRVDRLDPFSERTINHLDSVCSFINDVACWLDASRRQLDMYSDQVDAQMDYFEALIAAGDKAGARKLMEAKRKGWMLQYATLGNYLEQHHRSLLGEAPPVGIERILREVKSSPDAVSFALESLGRAGRGADQARLLPYAAPSLTYSMEYLYYSRAAGLRRTPEFWAYVDKVGLLDYWRRSKRWPDFCKTERVCEEHLKN